MLHHRGLVAGDSIYRVMLLCYWCVAVPNHAEVEILCYYR